MSTYDSEPPRSWERPPQAEIPRLKGLEDLSLHDLEAVRLILSGASVIDLPKLQFHTREEARQFLKNHEFNPDLDGDRAFFRHIQGEAIRYLRRNFAFSIPASIEQAPIEEVLVLASGEGHKQLCACTILKAMHIINHMAGRELLFRLPVSDRDLFHFVEEKVYRVIGGMLTEGFPITEFVGGRKNLDSTYTKLLSKREATAAALYDKLRFRIVTRTIDHILPVLVYLTERLFPFNYVVPGESTNTLFNLNEYLRANATLRRLVHALDGDRKSEMPVGDNRFSARSYRVIHFVTDIPVRVPEHLLELAPPGSENLGPIVYMLCEFQVLDSESEAMNEHGDASHDAYKQRQREAVFQRLQLSPSERAPEAATPRKHSGTFLSPLEQLEGEPPRLSSALEPREPGLSAAADDHAPAADDEELRGDTLRPPSPR